MTRMNKDNTYEQIEAYLYNKMPAADRKAFEMALHKDHAFAQQFKEQQLEHQITEVILEEDLLQDLKKWDQLRKKTAPKNSVHIGYIVVGIVLLLLASLGYHLWSNKSKISPEQEVKTQHLIAQVNADSEILKSPFGIKRSIEELVKIAEMDKTRFDVKHHLGSHYYQENQFAIAIEYLKIFEQGSIDYHYKEKARFLLCLAYLKNEQFLQAKSIADKITASPTQPYHEYATKLKAILAEQSPPIQQ